MASVAQPHAPQPEQDKQQREQGERERNERRVTRARLVQRLVENDGDLPAFMNDLIHTQAVVVAGTEAAAFIVEGATEDGRPELRTVAHVRPDNVEDAVRRQALMAFREIVSQCLAEDKDGALRTDPGSPGETDPQFCLVTILRQDDRPVAATAVITRCRDESRALQRLNTMQLVAGYFELFLLKKQNEQARQSAKTHQDVFQLASTVATAEDYTASTAGLCNELATRTGATRVAIGWVKGTTADHVKLQAISHTEEFDKKQELSVQLVKVMEECLDQDEFVQFDPSGASTDNVTREAMALSQMEGGNRVVSVPLRKGDKVVGIMTLEFPPEKPAGPAESTMLAVAAELLAPQLFDRFQNDRYLVTKAGLSVRDNTKKVFGLRQHTLAKVLILAAIGLILFVVLYSPMYRVTAPFEFVPVQQRIVDAPYEGQIAEVLLDEGAVVKAGDVIARLDTDDLETERVTKLLAAQKSRATAKALRGRFDEGPEIRGQYEAELAAAEAAEAEAELLQSRIDKATITAPIDGIILQVPGQADLKERVGGVVRTGDPLVIVGDTSELKVEMRVADRDIENVDVGDVGTLATSALPGVKVPLKVDRIIPAAAADAQGGTNSFTVVAIPETQSKNWRASATGEARIDVEPRSLAWQATHRLLDWLRLKLWL